MIYVVIGLILLAVIYILVTFNSFVKLSNNVNEAFSTMDVYLKKRWDLIPNIVETVKGYAKHEENTLTEIVKLRNTKYDDLSSNDKIKTNEDLSSNIVKLMALVEAYPELKANENFLSLSKDLRSIEDEIAQSRKYYNAVVRDYNNKVQMIPSNIVAMIFGYKAKMMFVASDSDKENVKVEL